VRQKIGHIGIQNIGHIERRNDGQIVRQNIGHIGIHNTGHIERHNKGQIEATECASCLQGTKKIWLKNLKIFYAPRRFYHNCLLCC
jgi:hypothetical protein